MSISRAEVIHLSGTASQHALFVYQLTISYGSCSHEANCSFINSQSDSSIYITASGIYFRMFSYRLTISVSSRLKIRLILPKSERLIASDTLHAQPPSNLHKTYKSKKIIVIRYILSNPCSSFKITKESPVSHRALKSSTGYITQMFPYSMLFLLSSSTTYMKVRSILRNFHQQQDLTSPVFHYDFVSIEKDVISQMPTVLITVGISVNQIESELIISYQISLSCRATREYRRHNFSSTQNGDKRCQFPVFHYRWS